MPSSNTNPPARTVNRRTVAQGLAWSVPAVAVAAAAPAYAVSAQTATVLMGMFNTVDANGYGIDSYSPYSAGPIQQGFQQGTLNYGDYQWSDSTGYPTIPINGTSVSKHVINEQGSYTPGGTGGTVYGQNYYGSGMWISSPVAADGVTPVAGTTTLKAGAVFQMCLKIVGEYSTSFGKVLAPSGYTQTTSLSANMTSNGTRIAMNGVSETLTQTTWTTTHQGTTTDTGTGCITFKTNADLVISNGGTAANPTIRYNQLSLTPGLQTSYGLGNGVLLYCSTLSFVSGTVTTTIGGQTYPETTTQLGTVTSYVRATTSNKYTGPTPFAGTC